MRDWKMQYVDNEEPLKNGWSRNFVKMYYGLSSTGGI